MTIVRSVVMLLAVLSARVALADPNQTCVLRCYEKKSDGYQDCRSVPPSDRAGRQACFDRADAQLKHCLAECGRRGGGSQRQFI